ncbi:MAG: hypothetical protein HY644_07230 [Acidobacteria bacterium]|nr:hypothetical protein [Acidobacteriota bacterium]
MKTTLIIPALLVAAIVLTFALPEPARQPEQQPSPVTMTCPMMGPMPGAPGRVVRGNTQETIQGMVQRMSGMFAFSAEELSNALAQKKTELGLSDPQVKKVADLIASLQQEKATEHVRRMMEQTPAGTCPCAQPASK